MPNRPHSKRDIHYFYLSSDALIYSCPIPKLHVKKGNNAHVLAVEAQVKMTLSEYLKNAKVHMEYAHAEKMIHCIGNQLKKLEAKEYGIPSFNLDDITVFFILKPEIKNTHSDEEGDEDESSDNDKNTIYDSKYDIYFAITNDDKVCTFDNNYNDTDNEPTASSSWSANPIHDQQLVINSPFKQEYTTPTSSYQKNKVFISPEFEKFTKTKELPYHIHFKSGYYSFGLLCIYCFLTKKNITFVRENTKNKVFKELEDCLEDEEGDEDLHKSKSKSKLDSLSVTSVLQTIINTKIYWFLIRVLNRTPSARQYICL